MRLQRRSLLLLLLAVTAWWGMSQLRERVEIAMLHVRGPDRDFYTRLWVVEAPPDLWLRAERPDRLWLEAVRHDPNVTLWRGEQRYRMRAVVWNGRAADRRSEVDRLFRAKYGWLDVLAGLVWRRDSVPVRLEPR